MNQPSRLKPLFHPGKLLITRVALAALSENGVPVISVMLRHIAGDWGTVSDTDRQQNDLSIAAGLRLLSIYHLPDGNRIIVTTEWDRSNTAIERLNEAVACSEPCPACTPNRSRPRWPVPDYLVEACS